MKYLVAIMAAIGIMTSGNTAPADQQIKVELRKELIPICACESTGDKNKEPTHYDKDGNVLLGKINPKDTGICQINLTAHKKQADKMGLDLFKESDNIIYANWLYAKEGSKPWNWSRNCWK